ncbi:discoidin domain-containing protein [Streptomyces sp. WAC07094]|uniref:galactose-binding domain-containing protein n=1 Tax=Streptomyces sp. WAC07094 TaxID=3072183 RepID=UPI002F2625D3
MRENEPRRASRVDLGAEYAVSTAVLNWEAAYGKAYRIQVSDYSTHWTDAYSTTTGQGGTETVSVNKNARYVRMQGVTPATQYGYSLWEFEIYGTALAGPGTGGATVYGDAGYGGPSATFGAGSYDLPALQAKGIANDSISSLRVPAGYTVTGYADAGFSGTAWTYSSDTTELTAGGSNDMISSLRVTSGS